MQTVKNSGWIENWEREEDCLFLALFTGCLRCVLQEKEVTLVRILVFSKHNDRLFMIVSRDIVPFLSSFSPSFIHSLSILWTFSFLLLLLIYIHISLLSI